MQLCLCLYLRNLPRCRRPRHLPVVLVIPLILFLIFTGKLEEGLSHFLPLFRYQPSQFSTLIVSKPLPPLLISPSRACSNLPFLLILVTSSPSHLDRRDAIRQTWGSRSTSALSDSLTVFLLAVPESQDEKAVLAQESMLHGDIIQAEFADTYQNLTLKTLVGLTWATEHCPNAKFVLKTDDDVFVNTLTLLKFLKWQKGPLYMGRLHWHVSPIREADSRHYTPMDTYEGNYFPPYCSGTGYILSLDVVRHLLVQREQITLISLEDVYIGLLAYRAGISPLHSAKVAGSMTLPHDGCCYRTMFTSHKVTPQRMVEAWAMLEEAENKWCSLALLSCKIQ
uniref:Hexosyltransferase n=1 Tax=Leptobrachium leishanense TaxID=445787 RepID=A0A8C5WGN5_9ANUR